MQLGLTGTAKNPGAFHKLGKLVTNGASICQVSLFRHSSPLQPPASDFNSGRLGLLTGEPRGVDVVGVVAVGAGRQVDPRGVSGEQVGRAVLVLVADEQRRGVLRLWRVVRRHDLQQRRERKGTLVLSRFTRVQRPRRASSYWVPSPLSL